MIERLRHYRMDMPRHARECLKVITKEALLKPLILNKPQLIIHKMLEEQREKHGLVRAIILKGRKQGASTYIGARFYNRTRLYKHRVAKVMAHKSDSTDALFKMVKTYYENDPVALRADTSNAKQYKFSNGSSYEVATAGGSGEAGRGDTPTLAHMSEVAFYPSAEKTFAGFANSVPLAQGTEIIIESTANGIGNEFHKRWMNAEAGLEEAGIAGAVRYIPIFIPWFWSDEYALPVPPGFDLSPDPEGDGLPSEQEIFEIHGLTMEQMVWRRFQVYETLGSVEKFMQEYPNTPSEAFQTVDVTPYIKSIYIMRARRRQGTQGYGPKILGVDPNGEGSDKFSMTYRQGFKVHWQRSRQGMKPGEETAAWVAEVVRTEGIDRVNIDYGGGYGAALYSHLETSYPDVAAKTWKVDFGATSQAKMVRPDKPGPRNRRAEMYHRAREWFEDDLSGPSIPDEDPLQSDLSQVCAKMGGQSTDTLIEPKREIKKRLGRSPDDADSFVLTFAVPDSSIEVGLTEDPTPSRVAFAEGVVPKEPSAPVDDWGQGSTGYDSGGGWMG